MIFLNKKLNIYIDNLIIELPEITNTYAVVDTEFTKKNKLIVDCIGIYLPNLIEKYLVVFTAEDIDKDFHPIKSTLKAFGYDVQSPDVELLNDCIDTIQQIAEECINFNQSSKKINKAFKQMIEEGYFAHQIAYLNISPESLKLEKDKNTGVYLVTLKPEKIDIPIMTFYGFADLFKIFGKKYNEWLLKANFTQQRCIKLRNSRGRDTPLSEFIFINQRLYEFSYSMRETMYRFPPVQKSLDAQTSIFQVEAKKINVKTKEIAGSLGLKNPSDVMSNFSRFLEVNPNLGLQYHAQDILATYGLHQKQQEFFDLILGDFGLESIPVSDTTGSNVAKFIIECIKKEFNADKETEKSIKEVIKFSHLDNLEEIPLNDFGCQPFLTVGGLLYTRMALTPYIQGYLGDCDLKSCYASFMSQMNIYLGEPITLTAKYQKYKLTLKEAVRIIENQKAPHDGWFIRVTGKFDKVINTLIMSDLKFQPKSIKQQKLYEVNNNRKSIESFNAYKTTKRSAQSVLLKKEVKFGLITKSLLEVINKMPADWQEEYLKLKCDVICFYPGDLIADSLEEYQKIYSSLPHYDRIEKFNIKEGVKQIDSQRYKNNATLVFPIHKYWKTLKDKRGQYKKDENPVQEVFKLFQNSGYGVLACLHLPTNSLMASNQITAAARSGAYLMLMALNGFGAITDGTGFSWGHIPIGKTFHEILCDNPSYVEHFDSNIQSNVQVDGNFRYQNWIDENLKDHMKRFYLIDENDYNINQFDHELKTEKFLTQKGKEYFENTPQEDVEELKHELGIGWGKYLAKNNYTFETPLFTKFFNSNAGNYCKGMDGGSFLIEGQEYSLVDNEPFVKARSFQGNDNKLIDWYCDAISNGYNQPLIYSEKKLIKFGDGCKIAIRMLETGSQKIAHPMGFETTAYKMMKIITRSQFLFQNETQLRNFETNEVRLCNLSNELGLNQKSFWDKLIPDDIKSYGIEYRGNVDYLSYAKTHPVGVGFELLALSKNVGGNIQNIRSKIVDLINKGSKNFSKDLNIPHYLKKALPLKNLFAAIIVAKKNAEDDLRALLENSANEPTIFSVTGDNMRRLHELRNNSQIED